MVSILDYVTRIAQGQQQVGGFAAPLAQRLAQAALAAQQPTLAGHDVSGIPLLSGILRPSVEALNLAGLLNEGAQHAAEAATGAGLAANAQFNPFVHLLPDAPGSQLVQQAGQAFGDNGGGLAGAVAANTAAQHGNAVATALLNAELNPLNLAGPVGEAGAGLRAAEGAGTGVRALGSLLEALGATGRAATLPYEGGFGAAGGLIKFGKQAIAPAKAVAASGAASAVDRAVATGAASPSFSRATMNLLAQKGIDPAKLAGLDADMAQYVAENAKPGMEDGLIASLRAAAPTEATPAVEALKSLETPPETPPAITAATAPAPPPAPETGALNLETPPQTARRDWLDTFDQMGVSDKARMLHDLLTANYGEGGGPVAVLRNIYGRGYVNPSEMGAAFDHLIQRTAENPDALAALELRNAPLAHAIPTIEPSPQSAVELQNAIRQSLGQPAKKGTQFAGDLAAGGGGFGLVPFGGPLPDVAIRGLLGGGLGGAAGALKPEDRPEDRLRNAALGAMAGATAGTVGGSPVARAIAEDAGAAMDRALAEGERSIIPGKPGQGRFAATTSYLRQARKTGLFTIPRNLLDDAAKLALAGHNPLQYAADVAAMVGESPTALPALRGAAGDTEQQALARYAQLPDRYRRQFDPEMFQKLLGAVGTDYVNDVTDLGSANVHPGYAALRGAGMALASPRVLVTGAATPLLGAVEAASLPARAAAQHAILGPADIAARLLPAAPVAREELANAAPAFIKKVAASGQSTALLGADGSFGASLIKDPALADEWRAIQQAAADKAGAASRDVLGNFANEGGARKVLNTLFPGAVWNIGQAQVLARAAARHPQLALAALHLMQEDYQRHLAEGDPEHAGTWRITDRTPGLGLLARIANGGAAGNLDTPLSYAFSPFGGETLNLPRQLDPYLNPGQNLYDKAKTIGAALGASDNPLLDMAAYRAGLSSQPHADPMRSMPVGQALDQLAAGRGLLPLGANPLATALTPEGKQQDVGTALRLGRYLDPAALRAGAEIVQERTGKPLLDPANIDYAAQLHDPSSALYQEALARGLGARAAQAAIGEVVPGSPQATTATQAAVDQATMALMRQGLPVTKAQLAMLQADPEGARALLGAQFQARIDQAKRENPLLATYDAANPGMLATLLMSRWTKDNALLGFFPGIMDYERNIEAERLGLVPPGTLAGKQQTMDLVNQGILAGLPQVAPGVPMRVDPSLADRLRSLNQPRR